tara:strand:- start:232 stop:522 length:291 start_codon:yes stop_codon:yes gene_type:complete
MSQEPTAAQVREILKPYARKLIGEVTGAALAEADKAHPLIRSLASEIMGLAINEQTVNAVLGVVEALLLEVLGDDYPLVIDAQKAVILDERSGKKD